MKTMVNENIEIKKELIAWKGQQNEIIHVSTYAEQVKSNGPVVLITSNANIIECKFKNSSVKSYIHQSFSALGRL